MSSHKVYKENLSNSVKKIDQKPLKSQSGGHKFFGVIFIVRKY